MASEAELTRKLRPRIYKNTILAMLAYAITAIIAFASVYLELSHYGYTPFQYLLAVVILVNILFLAMTYSRNTISKRFSDRMLIAQLSVWFFAFSVTLFYMADLRVILLMSSIMAFTFAISYLKLQVSIYMVFVIAVTYFVISYLGIAHFNQPGNLSYEILVLICFIPVCIFISYMADRIGKQRRILKSTLAHLEAIREERERIMQELEKSASTDDLTGLYNRRAINLKLQHEYERVCRYESDLTIILVDVDHFKRINDTHGHLFGDQALKIIANVLERSVRVTDFVARWGGEEFLVVLPETDLGGGKTIAQRILKDIAQTQLDCDGQIISLTISAGLHQITPNQTLEEAIARVDEYLYQAKQQGRNRVVEGG